MCVKIVRLFLSAESESNKGTSDRRYNSTDVIVHVEEEHPYGGKGIKKYVATFFTYDSIWEMQDVHHKSGEYLNGKYFFARNMVLIDHCCRESITAVVDHIIDEGDFNDVFQLL